jgi:hypothetical protein
MIGARCADLIAEAVVSMEFKASAEDIKNVTRASYFCRSERSCQQLQIKAIHIVSTILH